MLAVAHGSTVFIDSPEAGDYNFFLAVDQGDIVALGLLHALLLLFRNSGCLCINKGERDEFTFQLWVLQELKVLRIVELHCLSLDFCADFSVGFFNHTARCLSDRFVMNFITLTNGM